MRNIHAVWGTILLMLTSLHCHAISDIHIKIGNIETITAEANNIDLKVDLKSAQPSLKFSSTVKPTKYSAALDIVVTCGRFETSKIGEIQCVDGLLTSERTRIPFVMRATNNNEGLHAQLAVNNASFSDAPGLHSGEKLTGIFDIAMKQELINNIATWRWNTTIDWSQGEVFWEPFYFATAGHHFNAHGLFNNEYFTVSQADLSLQDLGAISLTSQIRLKDNFIEALSLNAKEANFAALYPLILKPLAEKTAFNNLEVSGKADLIVNMLQGRTKNFELNLHNANVVDNNGKFSFNHINAHIPWDYDEEKNATFGYASGKVLNLPLGLTNLNVALNRFAITAPQLNLPFLDGAFNFTDFSAAYNNHQVYWHVKMDMAPFSMEDFSTALGWPKMAGKVSANIPLVTYANGNLNMDGNMLFRVFNGVATVSDLSIQDPLGIVPKLYANIKLRDLDLGALTRTYSFGAIEGKLDGDVEKLQLQNWRPVYFNARVKTSDGDFPKKISQRAVENITALGGEGTAAALQRVFLRFFKAFNYEKIGLSCQLRSDICLMGGVESTAGGYVIVKGKGIPSVNVNGFTDRVSLTDLLSRLKRITDGNTKVLVE